MFSAQGVSSDWACRASCRLAGFLLVNYFYELVIFLFSSGGE